MSDTPRTEKEVISEGYATDFVSADFARTLERELNTRAESAQEVEKLKQDLTFEKKCHENWREDAQSCHTYINRIGKLLECNGDDTPEIRITEMQSELQRLREVEKVAKEICYEWHFDCNQEVIERLKASLGKEGA